MVQWLGLHASTAGGTGSIPGWETKILQAIWCVPLGKKKKERGRKIRHREDLRTVAEVREERRCYAPGFED